jgi:IMP dehydrogenase/GMP reductase
VGLGYDDINLIPRVISHIEHRGDVDTSSVFAGVKLTVPLIGAPMPDVCDGKMVALLREYGAYGFIHRFNTIEEQVNEFKISKGAGGCAIGATGDYLERFQALHKEGCNSFCIDTANGAHINVKRAIDKIMTSGHSVFLTAGNICSQENFDWLQNQSVYAIRCGIAGGGACTTKTETGIHSAMVDMLINVTSNKYPITLSDDGMWVSYPDREIKSKVIADGSCKIPADLCKALAVGANFVMAGSILASCRESPAKPCGVTKIFRGAASASVQEQSGKIPQYIEGTTNYLLSTGPLLHTIERFRNGLRSSMSYFNARNLQEYRKNVTWQ